MQSNEIEKILWADRWTKKNFLGCYPSNRIPTKIYSYPASLIINLDTADKSGSHWVAAYMENSDTVDYFDSFGPLNCIYPASFKPEPYCLTGPNSRIYEFLNRFKTVKLNKYVYQSIFAPNCAHYCIFFIHAKSIGLPSDKIVAVLLNQRDPNNFVYEFVKNLSDMNE